MYIDKFSIDVNRLGIREDLDTFLICIPFSYRQGVFPSISLHGLTINTETRSKALPKCSGLLPEAQISDVGYRQDDSSLSLFQVENLFWYPRCIPRI